MTESAELALELAGGRFVRYDGVATFYTCEHGSLGVNEARAIAKLTGLVRVELRECKIEPCFLEAVAQSRTIDSFEAAKSGLSDRSLEILSKSTILESINVGVEAAISDAGVAFVSRIKSLETVGIRGCSSVTDKAVSYLSALEKVESISFRGCRGITGAGLSSLIALKLTSLDFSSTGLTDGNALLLAKFPKLAHLGTDFTEIGDHSARTVINTCVSVRGLEFQRTKITDSAFDGLNGESRATSIDLFETKVTCTGLQKLHCLKYLKEIYYGGPVDAKGAAGLKSLQSLRYLYLGDDVSPRERALLERTLPDVDVL
jgi:hypothetical protein